MYVIANENFKRYRRTPKELDFIPEKGYIFQVSEERFLALSGNNDLKVRFVEKMPYPDREKAEKHGKERNKIGIIIPNCNYGTLLERCFNSILNQTYKNFEIIFVDDCSTDDSVKIAKSILKKPHKVIELKQKRYNGGSRNEGYLHLSEDVDYVWYVDSDDYLPDDKCLEKINDKLKTAPDVLFVGLYTIPKHGARFMTLPTYRDKYEACKGWSGSCGKVIRKELATRQECLYNEGTLKEDRTQHYKVCFYMSDFLCLDEPVYVWDRRNPISVTTIRDREKWGTSTIRHYADNKEFYLTIQGQDMMFDKIMESRLIQMQKEIERGGDRQL